MTPELPSCESDDGWVLAIRVIAMPRDTNAHGTIFGGYILSLIDQAGAMAAHKKGGGILVTVAMREVEFKEPVGVGDAITCWAKVMRLGKTSVAVRVRVVADSPTELGAATREVTEAEVVYVQVDSRGKPLPIRG